MRTPLTLAALSLIMLTSCEGLYPPTPKPDYTIHVTPSSTGNLVAIPPECPSWATATTNPYDNQATPQFGCANARNLAMMIERPDDLIKGRDGGGASPVTTVGAMRRYNNNQTRGLIWTSEKDPNIASVTTAPTAASTMTGDVSASSSSSSSSSSSAAAP